MGRLLLLALAVLILVWLLRRGLGGRQDAPPSGPQVPGELVACAHCGVHLPRGEARALDGALYCSDAHARLGPRRL